MSALLTFILAGAIVIPSRTPSDALSQSHSGLPRPGLGSMIRQRTGGLARAAQAKMGEDDGRRADGPARWLDLVRRRIGAVEGRQDPRADARAALCELGVRGRARLWRRDLQAARAHRAADPVRARRSTSPFPIRSTRSTRPSGWCWKRTTWSTPMCARWPGAARKSCRVPGAQQQGAPRDRRLGVAELFLGRGEAQGHPARVEQVEAPERRRPSRAGQGRRPLHDLHAVARTRRWPMAMPMR